MKQLILVRHAKSSWDFSVENDFDRPLNNRGHKDAPAMAKRLIDKKIPINGFVSSTAKRAFTTATYFYEAYQKAAIAPQIQLVEEPQLYHAAEPVFYKVIEQLSDAFETVALFSHNPGITYFINELTNTHIDNMPTCGIFGVKVNCTHWCDFRMAKKEFWFFDYPKNET